MLILTTFVAACSVCSQNKTQHLPVGLLQLICPPDTNITLNTQPLSSQLNIINLSSHLLTTDKISVLSKGFTFCPNNKLDTFEVIKDLHVYARKLLLKSKFEKEKLGSEGCRTYSQQQTLDNLNSLLEESDPRDPIDLESLLKQATDPSTETTTTITKSSLKKTSSLYQALSSNHGIATFLKLVCQEIKTLNPTSPSLGNLTSEKIALKKSIK